MKQTNRKMKNSKQHSAGVLKGLRCARMASGMIVAAGIAVLSACSSNFLDTMPDNRTTLDTGDKIVDLLTSAYPITSNLVNNELMSDNMDYMGPQNTEGDREGDMMYFWQDDKETGNDSPEEMWMNWNKSVAMANQALQSIEELGGATTAQLRNAKGEALLLRAYCNFLLTNEFCMAYNSKTSDKDLGVYYSKQVEKLTAAAPRGTVAEDYANMAQDIEEGLPLINDNYTVPKYHFNKQAAYAFATRFYLYYEKWNLAEKYASLLLGSNPASSLRNYAELEAMPKSTSDQSTKVAEAYCNVDKACNLLICTTLGDAGYVLGPWGYYKRYSHTNYLAQTETVASNNIWGSAGNLIWKGFNYNQGQDNFYVLRKIPFEFEYEDPVAGYGFRHALNVTFSVDETLLNRAEAYIMLKQYDKAAADMNTWMHNFFKTDSVLTPDMIQKYFNGIAYSYSDDSKMVGTPKKHLNPNFAIDAEGSVQETMLQCVLDLRRVETVHQGLRWFDIKRYNIVIPRRQIGSDGKPEKVIDWLKVNDPRMAVQIPQSITASGVTPNPRN